MTLLFLAPYRSLPPPFRCPSATPAPSQLLATAAVCVDQLGETGDRRKQFARFNRLGQVCLVASAKGTCAIFGPCVRGEGNGGNCPAVLDVHSTQLLDQVVAIHVWQPDVAHEDVGFASRHFGEGFGGATDGCNLCARRG
jgi:hypothetical protein